MRMGPHAAVLAILAAICYGLVRGDLALTAVVDAEIHALEEVTTLLETRRGLLHALTTNASVPIASAPDLFLDEAAHRFGQRVSHTELISLRVNSYMQHQRAKRKLDPAGEFLHLLAVVHGNGWLRLVNPVSLVEVWAVQTHVRHATAITSISGSRNAIALVDAHGAVTVFALRVYENGRLAMGEFVRRRPTDAPVCLVHAAPCVDAILASSVYRQLHPRMPVWVTSAAPQGGYHYEFERLYATKRFAVPIVTALTQTHHDMHLVVGTHDAQLLVFNKRGDRVRRTEVDGPIRALTPLTGGSVVFAFSNALGMVNVNGDGTPQTCVGSKDAIVSLLRDAQRPLMLFAGTSRGNVLVLHLQRLLAAAGRTAACHILHELRPMHEEADENDVVPHLMAWRKHVFVVARDQLTGYRVADDTAIRVLHREWPVPGTAVAAQLTRDAPSEATAAVHFLHSNGTRDVVVLQLLLTHEEMMYDVTWIRTPLLVLCAGGFIVWQRSKKKSAAAGSGVDEAELMRLAEQFGHRFGATT
ncbi:hypothetical protein SPRG_03708 [Saprolegnia parasitica CBS 223.65]|uniref:CNH domain-containing protein n=1 Tax=Saprolegnia parasitica (strain CBS 223.65) TaxID=695850 RepID=A0A067CMS3_SAPPC|nr:hypothetical protein SPRG_03708 [Saprolegnia parasitica CBS 223.65]KDO31788.1 hypothetical protein SPRG_03708 [Saprolegnia parasitica CBS 223.65]|eukprot:XP_012197668.1 hypothetical protein SPRG_03708 [Saprolegnia parasitica CBS 223.65]